MGIFRGPSKTVGFIWDGFHPSQSLPLLRVSLSISLLLFRCLASHHCPFRDLVSFSRRLMVSQCHCHSQPSPSTLKPPHFSLSLPALSLTENCHSQYAINYAPLCSAFSLHAQGFPILLFRANMCTDIWQCRFHHTETFFSLCEIYWCLSGKMENYPLLRLVMTFKNNQALSFILSKNAQWPVMTGKKCFSLLCI